MGALRDLAERMWQGAFDSVRDHPVHARVDAPEEIADGVLTFKGIASANTFDTGDGLVMLDTGAKPEAAAIQPAAPRSRPGHRAPLAPGATARRGGVLAPSRGPRVRHDPVRGRIGGERLGPAHRLRPPRRRAKRSHPQSAR